MTDALAQKVTDATAGAQELAGKVADQAREYGEQAQEAVKNFKPYVEKSLKEQPMATLAVGGLPSVRGKFPCGSFAGIVRAKHDLVGQGVRNGRLLNY